MKNSLIAKHWIEQDKSSAQGSHFFFEGTKIYSYGYHFMIAEIVGDSVIYNNQKYSQSTSKHQSYVLREIKSSNYKLEYKDES